jgi:hypothetical protein
MKIALLGTAGIGAIEGVEHIPAPTITFEYVKLGVQIVLGILTFLKMTKESKNNNQNNNLT